MRKEAKKCAKKSTNVVYFDQRMLAHAFADQNTQHTNLNQVRKQEEFKFVSFYNFPQLKKENVISKILILNKGFLGTV